MREILFRGQRKDNGEWIEGYYVRLGEHHYILTGKLDITKGFPIFVHYEVLPETVGQYTGLTDKNDKKIFEGDIVESRASENKEDWKLWKVSFENGCFVFDSEKKSIKSRRKFKHEQCMICAEEIEFYGLVVIGNIHDNPELLKQED